MNHPQPGGSYRGEDVVVFGVGDERFALPLEVVGRISGESPAGGATEAIAAERLFGIAEEATGDRRSLELEHRGRALIFTVPRVEGVTRIEREALRSPPAYFEAATRTLVRGVLPLEGAILIMLDPDALFARAEAALEGTG